MSHNFHDEIFFSTTDTHFQLNLAGIKEVFMRIPKSLSLIEIASIYIFLYLIY
jgi:hypothetical protein